MKDFTVTCFGDHSTSVANSNPSQNSVTCFYRATVYSGRKQLIITITWTKRIADALGSLIVEDKSNQTEPNPQMLRKKKLTRSFSNFTLHYDLTQVKLGSGPEPIKDFYIVLFADSHPCLVLGDKHREFFNNSSEQSIPEAKFSVFSRKEQVVNTAFYSTKSRFREGGKEHEIVVRCRGDEGDEKGSELQIFVDRLRVVCVETVRWNFRGNKTVYVEDGFAVDVMWDVHDLWFYGSSRSGWFVFRTRSALESRLWCDEEIEKGVYGFSLIIQFCRGY